MNDLDQLAGATDALYQAERAKLQDIARQEAELRRALFDLDAKRHAAWTMPADQLAAPRAIGADMLWQGWTQRTRQELNVKLAQVLVRKADRMAALARAFGRAEVARTLLADAKTARRKDAQGRAERAAQDLALLRGYRS